MSERQHDPSGPTDVEPPWEKYARRPCDDSALSGHRLDVSGLTVRVARQTGQLEAIVAFYRDGLGLPEIDRFTDHDGYDGVMLDLPGTSAHLEFTATAHIDPPHPHVEQLLVLYVGNRQTVDMLLARCGADPVRSANPYWDRVGATVSDPDGFRVVLVASTWPD
jgi:catechol 2,3-dioxygenase-like lactoylglutathione lyase family enzyme